MVATVRAPHRTPFSIGRVLNDTFRVFGHISVPVIVIVLAVNLALRFAYQPDTVTDIIAQGGQSWTGLLVNSLVTPLLSDLQQVLIVFAVLRSIRRKKVSLVDFTRGFSSMPFVAGASIVTTIPVLAGATAQKLLSSSPVWVGIAAFVTGIAMLVVKLVFWVVTPCIAAEGKGVLDGLRRSAQLSKDRRWGIFGLSLIVGVSALAMLFTISIFTGVPVTSLQAVEPDSLPGLIVLAADTLLGALFLMLVVVSYHHLRIEKDGVDVEHMVTVFD